MQSVFNPNILIYHPPNSAEGVHFSAFHFLLIWHSQGMNAPTSLFTIQKYKILQRGSRNESAKIQRYIREVRILRMRAENILPSTSLNFVNLQGCFFTSSRGAAWLDEEVLALLSVWGDEKVQEELDGACSPKDKLHQLITAYLYKFCNYSLMCNCVRRCVNTLNWFKKKPV